MAIMDGKIKVLKKMCLVVQGGELAKQTEVKMLAINWNETISNAKNIVAP